VISAIWLKVICGYLWVCVCICKKDVLQRTRQCLRMDEKFLHVYLLLCVCA
jgi:hypothetical protein